MPFPASVMVRHHGMDTIAMARSRHGTPGTRDEACRPCGELTGQRSLPTVLLNLIRIVSANWRITTMKQAPNPCLIHDCMADPTRQFCPPRNLSKTLKVQLRIMPRGNIYLSPQFFRLLAGGASSPIAVDCCGWINGRPRRDPVPAMNAQT